MSALRFVLQYFIKSLEMVRTALKDVGNFNINATPVLIRKKINSEHFKINLV
jgi:hypothetical protein